MPTLFTDQVEFDETNATYWNNQSFNPGTVETATQPQQIHGSYFQVGFTRSEIAGIPQDLAMFGMHFVMRPGVAGLSDHLNAADAQAVENSFGIKCWDVFKAAVADDWVYSYFAWRNFGADFPRDPNGVCKYGPIWRSTTLSSPGLSTYARLPDQVALTASFHTSSRRHWGRVYTGGYSNLALSDTNKGHAVSTTIDSIAKGFRDWFVDVSALSRVVQPVIWSAKHRGILSIKTIVVDDVFDVVRRRRARGASYRKTYTS